ncbi:hypothetical protein GC722_15580 [Auraticoccus sp. F435]|uniref:Uncharacterized protein n=1 Tax=Auraticoccus cholistanensis TaxID=2656650 RepID=A0A6A9V1L3_9ACTN|nr:hypothetical protein [Auraticoccus cholistanensis]MVA77430.1 hypothetical protein [Auraticoccus cholistanensis]
MSIWTDQSLEDDPLDPTRDLPSAAAPGPGPVGPAAAPVDVLPDPADGEDGLISDPSGAVSVRLDEDRFRVLELRVSTRWRERLKRAGVELGAAVVVACRRGQLGPPRGPVAAGFAALELPSGPRRAPGDRSIDWAAFNTLLDTTLALSEESARLRARPPEEVERATLSSPLAEGRSANGRVRVVLAAAGPVQRVEVDRQWAHEHARVSELTAALEQAMTAAYDAWQPPRYEPGELDRLVERRLEHRRELLSLLSGRLP